METEPNNIQSEVQTAPEQEAPLQTKPGPKPEPEHVPDKANSSPAGQMPRFIRLGLIWLGIIVVAFLAGALTYHFVRYKPMETILSQVNQSVADLQTKSDSLTNQLDTANSKISTLESDNRSLKTSLDAANMHIDLLQALAEIYSAHIALANKDIAGAKVALSSTTKRLETMKPGIASVDTALADNITQRLTLIKASMENDPESAKAELGLLAKNLLNVETLLFTQ